MKIGKYTYSPVRLSVFLVILVVWLIIGNIWYNKYDYTETWVVCDYKSSNDYFKETIKFRYILETLYGYYEERTLDVDDEELQAGALAEMEKFGENLPTQDKNIKYKVIKNEKGLSTSFYLNTISYGDFFNTYVEETGITYRTPANEIESKLNGEYECKISKKRGKYE